MALLFYSVASLSFFALLVFVRVVLKTNLVLIVARAWRSFTDLFHVHQLYKVPRFSDDQFFQENLLYRQIETYLASLPSVDDSAVSDLISGSSSGDLIVRLGSGDSVRDEFLGAKLEWTKFPTSFALKLRRTDRRRIFRQYIRRIQAVADEIDRRKGEIKLQIAVSSGGDRRWRTVNFSHPASFDTVVVEPEIKSRIVSDLELFAKSRQYYHRIGRIWRRSYLLSGASGTGKTSFVAAMAKFLRYDVYDLGFTGDSDHSDLKNLILQTAPRSVIVVEDLGRNFSSGDSSPASFIDGIVSCCGEERILVFTMNDQDRERLDRTVKKIGRIDVHVHLPLCDNFSAFKSLASNYLGLKEHKLFPQVEEIFQNGIAGFLSPAQIGEIMLSNRASPSRALKSVISALQNTNGPQRLSNSSSGRGSDENGPVFCREGIHAVGDFRKLYGLLRMGSRRKEEPNMDLASGDKEGSRHQ